VLSLKAPLSVVVVLSALVNEKLSLLAKLSLPRSLRLTPP
jgi:hypothetical protein